MLTRMNFSENSTSPMPAAKRKRIDLSARLGVLDSGSDDEDDPEDQDDGEVMSAVEKCVVEFMKKIDEDRKKKDEKRKGTIGYWKGRLKAAKSEARHGKDKDVLHQLMCQICLNIAGIRTFLLFFLLSQNNMIKKCYISVGALISSADVERDFSACSLVDIPKRNRY